MAILTSSDPLADSYCPIASIKRKSGPKIPKQASLSLSRKRCHLFSVVAGILTQTEVQQQRKIVEMQVKMMSSVPRPPFCGTQP